MCVPAEPFLTCTRANTPWGPPTPHLGQLPLAPKDKHCSPRRTGPTSAGCRARLAGAASCTNHTTEIGGGGASAPQRASAAQTQEMAVHSAGRGAQGSGGWQCARLEKEGAGGAAGRGGRCLPRRLPPHTHFHFLPASPAGAAYLTDRLRPSELTFQARAGCCGGKAITPLYKNKTKIDRCRLGLLPRTSPRRGWGWIEASEELLGRDSRGLPTPPRVTRKVRAKQPTPPRVPSRPRRREPYLSGSVTASTHQGLTTEKGKHRALFANKRPDSRLREDGGGGGKGEVPNS